MTRHSKPIALLATAPLVSYRSTSEGDKRKLFTCEDDSSESSPVDFPYPLPSRLLALLFYKSVAFADHLCARARDVYPQLRTSELLQVHVWGRSTRSRVGFSSKQDTESGLTLCFRQS